MGVACIAGAQMHGQEQQQQSSPMAQALSQQFAQSTFPGACVAVIRNGAVVHRQSFGYADVAAQRPYTSRTVQPVGSVSKTIIGLALMRAVEQGRVDLDAPVGGLLDFKLADPYRRQLPQQAITLRQLATHTSGIVDQEAAYRASYQFGRSRPNVAMGAYLKFYLAPGGRSAQRANFAQAAPGAEFHYSNVGATLAAYAIERAVAMPFAEFSESQILRPLHMTDSGWFARSDQARRTATLYTPRRTPVGPYTSITYPDGSLRSTCDDLTRLALAVLHGANGQHADGAAAPLPISHAGFMQMLAPQFADHAKPAGLPAAEPNQGLFFVHRRDGSVGHSGSDDGLSAFVFVHLPTGSARVFMSNVDIQEEPALQKSFARIWQLMGTSLPGSE